MDVEGWKSFFEVGGVVLLFLTFAFGAGFMLTGKSVNDRQAERLRKFESDLTGAKTELATQQERAAKAEASIALAEQHSAEANAKAEGFRLEIAKANEAAEQEKSARVRIEERLAWRRVSPEQHKEFVRALTPFAGSMLVVAAFNNADIESKTFAADLSHALNDAGWHAPLNLSNTVSNLPVGIICSIDTSKEAGRALKRLLSQQFPGVSVSERKFSGAVAIGSIVVGLRPPP